MGQHNYISIPYTLVLSLCIRYRIAGSLKAQGMVAATATLQIRRFIQIFFFL